MTITANAGPHVVFPDPVNGANPELGPSMIIQGSALLDPRSFYTYQPGQNFGAATAGWCLNSRITTINAIPMTKSVNIISTAAHIVGGTPVTLVSSNADGIATGVKIVRADTGVLTPGLLKLDPLVASVTASLTLNSNIMTVTAVTAAGGHCYNQLCAGMVLTDASTAGNLPTGVYITGWAPNGGGTGFGGLGTYTLSANATATAASDTVTGLFTNVFANGQLYPTVPYGQAGTVQLWNPGDMSSRALVVTTTTSQVAQTITVNGFDVYGYPMTEGIVLSGTSATTTNGKKAFKYIQSITPATTDGTGNYAFGTQDVVGLPMRSDNYQVGAEFDVSLMFNNAAIASSTGYTAAILTTPTATTGDVRGTYGLQTASSGTLRLIATQTPQTAAYGTAVGLFGQTQFASF